MTRIRGRDHHRPRELHRARRETSCRDLTAFAHDELDPARAAAFRAHLRSCDLCQHALPHHMTLSELLSEPRGGGR